MRSYVLSELACTASNQSSGESASTLRMHHQIRHAYGKAARGGVPRWHDWAQLGRLCGHELEEFRQPRFAEASAHANAHATQGRRYFESFIPVLWGLAVALHTCSGSTCLQAPPICWPHTTFAAFKKAEAV
eukprot:jgi/Ulvmu1/6320/UM029_0028.1